MSGASITAKYQMKKIFLWQSVNGLWKDIAASPWLNLKELYAAGFFSTKMENRKN
ncbi:MAG: hypothetical protein VX413_05040 [Verrucomicrobiota bacterium]|jgi:hypothetical protein|nr:hypothetical protein [Verrucomicrobiota bacterium]